VAGCGSFGRPADAWKEIMLQEFNLVHVFWGVNNNLFVKASTSTVNMKDVVERSSQLGVKTNTKKYSEFCDEQKFIGFIWNGRTRTVRLPLGEKDEQIKQISRFLVPGVNFTYHNAMVLAGRLNHASYVLPQLRCHLRSVYQWQKEWVNTSASRPASIEMQEELQKWSETLNRYNTH
jgi:hypothetical protein